MEPEGSLQCSKSPPLMGILMQMNPAHTLSPQATCQANFILFDLISINWRRVQIMELYTIFFSLMSLHYS
jgi:hypothetical protein